MPPIFFFLKLFLGLLGFDSEGGALPTRAEDASLYKTLSLVFFFLSLRALIAIISSKKDRTTKLNGAAGWG